MSIQTITPAIIKATIHEAAAFAKQNGDFIGQIIQKTNFKDSSEITYTFPLGLLDIMDDPDMSQYCGGTTRVAWNWAFNLYNYDPNAYGDDESGDSEDMLAWCDLVRQHFSTRCWLTQEMRDVECKYNYRFTLSGAQRADPLKYQEGLAKGWRFIMESIALDEITDSVQVYPDGKLENVTSELPDNS